MAMDDGNRLLLVKPATPARKPGMPDGDDGEVVADGDAYATVKGLRHAEGLRFIRRNRRCFTMPYDYRPLAWWDSPTLLLLEYPGFFTAALTGKGVAGLEPLIIDRRITWLRECTEAAAVSLPIAVFRIDILHAYPSREEEAIAGAD
jgi:hypothetical protein